MRRLHRRRRPGAVAHSERLLDRYYYHHRVERQAMHFSPPSGALRGRVCSSRAIAARNTIRLLGLPWTSLVVCTYVSWNVATQPLVRCARWRERPGGTRPWQAVGRLGQPPPNSDNPRFSMRFCRRAQAAACTPRHRRVIHLCPGSNNRPVRLLLVPSAALFLQLRVHKRTALLVHVC